MARSPRTNPGERGWSAPRKSQGPCPRAPGVGLLGVALVCAVVQAGCHTWQSVATGSPVDMIVAERPERVRLTVAGGATVTLDNPIVANDSIVSLAAPAANASFAVPRPGVPALIVEGVEVARFSRARTIALGAAIVAVSLGWARLASASNSGLPPNEEPEPKGIGRAEALAAWPGGPMPPDRTRVVLWRLSW